MIPGPVVVTGAQGWLGSRLVDRLRHERVEDLFAPDRAELDLAHAERVEAAFDGIRPRQVVHLAASLRRSDDPDSVAAQWRDTFFAGRNVVRAAAGAGVAHLVMAGSLDELGDCDGVVHVDAPARPLTTYGLCKSLVRDVAAFEARRTGCRVDWFRATTVYGPGQRGDMVIPYACAAALGGRAAQFTDGTQRRDFLYVDDLIDWLMLAVDGRVAEAGARGFHLHHLGTGVARAVRDVLDEIAAQLPGARFELGSLPRNPHQPPVQVVGQYADPCPALAAWRPRTDLRDGLTRTVAWWKAQPR